MPLPQRTARIYAAERFITEPWVSGELSAFQRIVDEVQAGDWWKTHAEDQEQILIKPGRSSRYGAIAYRRGRGRPGRITVSAQMWGPSLIAHELAHHSGSGGGHTFEWAAEYYQLLGEVLDGDEAERVQWEFAAGLAVERLSIEGIPSIADLVGDELAAQFPQMYDGEVARVLDDTLLRPVGGWRPMDLQAQKS